MTFVSIISSGDANGFENIPRDPSAEVALNNPQATLAYDLAGRDSAATSLDPAPMFSSPTMASDMGEVYWLSLTRDVPFREYHVRYNFPWRDAGRPDWPLSEPIPLA
jgi:hypothetical protein